MNHINLWLSLKKDIEKQIEKETGEKAKIEEPEKFGDFALACYSLAKKQKKNPADIAKELAKKIKHDFIEKSEPIGGYVNFYINWSVFGQMLLESVDEKYGSGNIKKNALIEHTSINPNASPHVGRARNAIIGDSIVRLLKFQGYKTEVHYFVNDVGKQIAILVYGCSLETKKKKFSDMLKIYSNTTKKIEKNPEKEKEIFKLLSEFEKGDKKTMSMFNEIVLLCVDGQKKILSDININYDYFDYESKYLINKKTEKVLKMLEKTGKLFIDEQKRKVLNLEGFGLSGDYLVLTRSDGTSLYPLRDIAYTIDKIKKAKDLNIVVLGEDQKLYFQQLSAALRLLGYIPPKIVHYSFVLLPSGKMSTRKGNVVLLEDFMKESHENALSEIEKRYPDISEKEKQKKAKAISTAAVRYTIVKVSPEKDVIFNISKALKFEGNTGPYLQYTYARAKSILEKSLPKKFNAKFLKDNREIAILNLLARYPSVIEKSAQELKPHIVAEYLHELADSFNTFYQILPVLKADENLKNARLKLVESTATVLKSGLNLLGIEAVERM